MKRFIRLPIMVILLIFVFSSKAFAACDDGSYTALGSYNGVMAYSNSPYTGTGNGDCQCVEYIKRFHDLESYSLGNGYAVCGTLAASHSFDYRTNGDSNYKPRVGDVLCFDYGQYGHVGVIYEVGNDNVMMIDQNRSSTSATIKLSLTKANGQYTIGGFGSYVATGWSSDSNFIPTNAQTAIQARVDSIGDTYIGTATDNNPPHWYNEDPTTFVVQDFSGGDWGELAIAYNEGDDTA